MALLEVKNLKKNFGTTEVLKGISFSLNEGEVLTIIGNSGSGKTTLLRCLNSLERADSGEIIVDGKVLFDGGTVAKKQESADEKLRFGMVFQNFNLFPHLNILRNITLAREIKAKKTLKIGYNIINGEKLGIKAARKKKKELKQNLFGAIETRAYELLDRVGLRDKAKAYPCQLSGGQQQRVAIARALALDPEILCFDEPTSALDPELTGEVLKVIKGLKGCDTTMIVVTHEMNFARNASDKIIFMSDGVIEEEGTPEEVFGNPKSEKTKAFIKQQE